MSSPRHTFRARRSRSALFVTLALLGLPSAAHAVVWQELGPAPLNDGFNLLTGRVSAVACNPIDPNRYFITGADGGVWRTTNGGTTWMPLRDQMPTTSMGALALDPTDPNVIYAGTGEANYAHHSRYGLGIFKSTDGGDTWTQLGESTFAGRCISRIVINPQNPQTVYVALARAGGFPALSAAKGHPSANGPVGVFRSDDGGTNWTQLAGGLPNQAATDLAFEPNNPNVLYAGIGHIFGATENGIYKSSDGGSTWNKLAGGLPTASVGRISLAVAPSQPSRVYTLITHSCDANGGNGGTLGAFRSDNSGTSWTALPQLGSVQSSYGWYLSVVTVQPTNANVVFMGGLDLYRSSNAGASWANTAPPHVDQHAAAWDASGRLVIGDDGGVHRTSDLGNNWIGFNDGLGIVQFYAGLSTHPTNTDYIIGGTQDNGSNRRSNATQDWLELFGGDGGWTQLDQMNTQRIFVEYQGSGNLYGSVDGGGSFNFTGSGISTADRNCFQPPYLINPTNSQRMLYGTHRVYRSTNGGSSWTALTGDLSGGNGAIRTLAMAPSDPNTVYAATTDGRVLRSSNGGTTFTLVATGVSGWQRTMRQIFVHPTDPLTVYLAVGAFGQSQVRRSTDGGQNWVALDATLPDVPVNTVAVDVRGVFPVIYAGADDGLYQSIDGGANWHTYGTGLPHVPVIDLRIEPTRRRLIAATQGRGMWSVPIAIPGDMNGDGAVDFGDINPFVLGLSDPVGYMQQYPQLDPNLSGDMNGDGVLNFADINGFVALLVG